MEKKEAKQMTFIEKVVSVQRDLKAPKGQYNKFGKYRYRSAEDILNSVKPLLASVGLVLTLEDEVCLIGARYYIKATAVLTDGTQNLVKSAYAREDEQHKGSDGAQITGAASSYARKYALNGLFCIDDTKDADATNDGTAQANNNQHEERVQLAIQEVDNAKSRKSLTDIWNNYSDLQADARFSQAVANASKNYPKP